ncbi:DUF2165 family protein [Thorsellia kenyensis]|uniref:DUF2165 family protein n=1 Tax=Thorsellia kenyensis TaxID=1549888 RepID=A0ABV6C6D1_9GAMM
MIVRYSKIIFCLCIALFAFMVAFGNITDYNSNFEFVKHVLSMDTTFEGNVLMYRSITNPTLWTVGYWGIIFGEALTSLLFFIATWQLFRHRNASTKVFSKGKNYVVLGATVAFLVWYLGFMVIGGEWFAMWQSKIWNGQQAAYRFYTSILLVLIYVMQSNDSIEESQ